MSDAADDVTIPRATGPALPPDDYLRELDALVAAHDVAAPDQVARAIAAGHASRDVVRRAALEGYCVAKWMAAELPLLISNAPDAYSFTMEHSTHYRHWARVFAGQAGYTSGPSRVQVAVDCCRGLGVDDDEVRAYTPLPETIAMTCTALFYVRRSYEEGVAVLGHAGARIVAGLSGVPALRDGLARHYGVTLPPAAEESEPGNDAARLLRLVATTRVVQERCRDALRNVLLTTECRVRAMNRWVE